MSTVLDLGVVPVANERGRYLVRSAGVTGGVYLVDLDYSIDPKEDACGGFACGCRDFEVRSGMMLYPAPDCKHIRYARMYQRLQRRFGSVRI